MPQLAHVAKIYLFGRPTWLGPCHVSSLTFKCAIYGGDAHSGGSNGGGSDGGGIDGRSGAGCSGATGQAVRNCQAWRW